jgi:transposase
MLGPSRHRELFAVSTSFSVVDSVGPARAPQAMREEVFTVELVVPRCAGLDVAKDEVVACVRVPDGGGGRRQEVRTYPTFTSGLEALAEWLAAEGVTQVVMEATGQYWKPIWWVLEEQGFALMLVNARHVKILPGRKTDVGDAAWLAELLEHGLLRGSFVPPAAIRELRDLTRYRKRLIQAHTAEAQRVQKTLEDAGIKLDSVAADVLGVSGRAMLAALVGGERDPQVLAELARGRLRSKLPQLRQALRGRFGDHHALLVRLALAHLEHLEGAIAALDRRVDEVIAPFARARDRLDTITGVGKRAAETIIAEIGVDMTVFPTAGHLASWAGRCPGNNLTGGKRRSGKPTKGNRWLGEVLIECAWAAARSRDTYLSAQYWRLARRIGKKKAAMAVGHSILVVAWHLLADDCDYADLGGDYFVRRDADRARQRAVARLQALGYQVTLEPLAA